MTFARKCKAPGWSLKACTGWKAPDGFSQISPTGGPTSADATIYFASLGSSRPSRPCSASALISWRWRGSQRKAVG
jgi:hypothetical protein